MSSPATSASRRAAVRQWLPARMERHATTTGAWAALALLILISALVSSSFLTSHNMLNIARQAAPLGIVTLGQTVVILAGGIDVSVGAVVSLTTVIAARVMAGSNALVLPTVLLVLAIGLLVGCTNGVLVARAKTDAFVTTLATMLIVGGAALVYTQGSPANDLTHDFRQISEGDVLGIPVSVAAFVALLLILWFALSRTVWGRQIYAVGANARATRLSGRPVNRVVASAYIVCSVLAVVGGLFLVARLGTGDVNAGAGWELESISAVLIGGTAFGGGRGGVMGPVAGVLILTILFNLADLLALPDYTQLIVKGVAIVLGVALYSRRTTK